MKKHSHHLKLESELPNSVRFNKSPRRGREWELCWAGRQRQSSLNTEGRTPEPGGGKVPEKAESQALKQKTPGLQAIQKRARSIVGPKPRGSVGGNLLGSFMPSFIASLPLGLTFPRPRTSQSGSTIQGQKWQSFRKSNKAGRHTFSHLFNRRGSWGSGGSDLLKVTQQTSC